MIHIHHNPQLLEKKTISLFCETWHEGILGIVASRLVRKFFRPVVLITLQNGLGKGSARSIPGFDLYNGLTACADTLEDFGGHAMAAGLSIKPDHIPNFKEKFEMVVKTQTNEDLFTRTYFIDTEINLEMITDQLMNELELLKPFGAGNPEPLFLAKNIKIVQSRVIGEHHRRLVLRQKGKAGRNTIQGIWFNVDPVKRLEDEYDEIIFNLRWNRWNGSKTAQIVIQDAKNGA